jgi:hypothetical protein
VDQGSFSSTISGGANHSIGLDSPRSTIGGGKFNSVGTSSPHATIGGGMNNSVGPNTDSAVIGGGASNTVSAAFAVVPGGSANLAGGDFSLAAGHRAQARHAGAFVWGDATDADVASTNSNQFVVRASGGYALYTATDLTAGVSLAPGAGAWSSLSDRDAKENFAPVDPREILAEVDALPVTSWNYKTQDPRIRHVGPTAQDFRAAFGMGESERTITTVDADGVALAAIQGLSRKLEEELRAKELRIRQLEQGLAELRERLASLAPDPVQPRAQVGASGTARR